LQASAEGYKPPVLSPIALEAVQRIDALFDIERGINGLPAEQRLAVRRERSAPLVSALEAWMRDERRKLSRHSDVAGAMDYMLKRWDAFARFLDDGRICLSTDDVEKEDLSFFHKFWRRCLPGRYHPLIGAFGAFDIAGFSFPDFLDPIVSAGTSLSIGPRRPGLQGDLSQLHSGEGRPCVGIVLIGRQNMPHEHCQLSRRRHGGGRRSTLVLYPRKEGAQWSWRRLRRPGRLNKHPPCVTVSLLRDAAVASGMIA